MRKGRKKVMLIIRTKKWELKLVKRKRLKYLSVAEKSHVETVNEKIKEGSIEEKEIEIRKCGKISWIDIMNKEVSGWTSSSKQQEAP